MTTEMERLAGLAKPDLPWRFHLFGDEEQWALSLDDGCLRFHPNMDEPERVSSWVWREAWQEVERMGGYDAAVQHLRAMILRDSHS